MNNKLKLKIGRIANVVIVIPMNVPAWAKDKNLLIKNNGYQIGHSDYCENILLGPKSLYIPNTFFGDEHVSCYECINVSEAIEWVNNITTIIKIANAEHPDNEETVIVPDSTKAVGIPMKALTFSSGFKAAQFVKCFKAAVAKVNVQFTVPVSEKYMIEWERCE